MADSKHIVIAAYGSLVVSVVAAAFAGLAWRDSYEHNRASLRPLLSFLYQPSASERKVGLKMENVGLGPAVLKSITYYVDRKPVKDADEVLAYGKINPERPLVEDYDFDADEPMSGIFDRTYDYSMRTSHGQASASSSWLL